MPRLAEQEPINYSQDVRWQEPGSMVRGQRLDNPLQFPKLSPQPLVNESPVSKQEVAESREVCESAWAAFGQILFAQEHKKQGRSIKKIAAVSMAYPSQSTAHMAKEVLATTLSVDLSNFVEWDGVNAGRKLVALSREVEGHDDLSVLDRFVDTSEEVIKNTHTDPKHEHVQDFITMQRNRRDFLSTVKQDVEEILHTPDFMEKSPFHPKYKGKGLYVQEMFVNEDGELLGVSPNGEIRPVVEIAADEPHQQWLLWLRNEVRKPGDRKIAHAEDDTVEHCGGKQGCSQFYQLMEGKIKQEDRVFHRNSYQEQYIMPTLTVSMNEYSRNDCKKHGKPLTECDCSSSEVASGE